MKKTKLAVQNDRLKRKVRKLEKALDEARSALKQGPFLGVQQPKVHSPHDPEQPEAEPEPEAEAASSSNPHRRLAQAALDVLVGLRIRAQGTQIQAYSLNNPMEFDDAETANSIHLIEQTAKRLDCQGIELLTPFFSPVNPTGFFGEDVSL